MSKVTVLILSFNEGDNLIRSVKSVLEQKVNFDFETLVIDNASEDGSIEKLKLVYPNLRILKLDKNYGTAAYNRALPINSNYIYFTSGDKYLDVNCLQESVNAIQNPTEKSLGYGLIAPLILRSDNGEIDVSGSWVKPWFYAGKNTNKIEEGLHEQPYFGMGLISQGALQAIGGNIYRDDYFLFNEDVELGFRLKEAGYKVGLCTKAKALHEVELRSSRFFTEEQLLYFSERNAYRTFHLHCKGLDYWLRLPLVLISRCIKIGFDLIRFKPNRAKARIEGLLES